MAGLLALSFFVVLGLATEAGGRTGELAIAFIADRPLYASDLFSLRGAPEHGAGGGGALTADRARTVLALRDYAVREVLREAQRLPDEVELRRLAHLYLPRPGLLRAQAEAIKAQNSKLNSALGRSESDPESDYSLWQDQLSRLMTYEQWVQFRIAAGGRRFVDSAPPSLQSPDGSEDWTPGLLCSLRRSVEEDRFQRWILSVWSPATAADSNNASGAGPDQPWSSDLQVRFWASWLSAHPLSLSADGNRELLEPSWFVAPRFSIQKIEVKQ